ncbi:MAG: precorrin-2 C(20)-methyltransferase [Eubacterium sp.]|nr:precorrin-2 C(20)-methyltransferase [Eubacterium sp.]
MAEMMNKGILMGVGVGVGDPEDMTLKAVRCIKESDIVCIPRKDKTKCRAYKIAREAVPEIDEKELLCLEFEMIKDEEALQKMHREIYEELKGYVEEGKKISLLTIGDPTVYSTFAYIAEQAEKDGVPVRIINGINSFCAAAAGLGISLCEGETPLHIISDLKDLQQRGTKIIMKCAGAMARIKSQLRELEQKAESKGSKLEVFAVSDAGMPQEKRYFSLDELPDEVPYMTTFIVRETTSCFSGD